MSSSNQSKDEQKTGLGMSRASLKRKRKSGMNGSSNVNQLNSITQDLITIKKNTTFTHSTSSKLDKSENLVTADVIDDVVDDVVDDVIDDVINMNTNSLLQILSLEEIIEITSYKRASMLWSLFLYPTTRSIFYKDFWDKKPIYCEKNNISWIKGIISRKSIEKLCDCHLMIYNEDISITRFHNDECYDYLDDLNLTKDNDYDETPISVKPVDIWIKVSEGNTLTLLQPQRYIDSIWKLLSALEIELNSALSCHILLTPSGCQGYGSKFSIGDNIFTQMYGKSLCKVYKKDMKPESESSLPEFPFLTVTLSPGDCLYIPNGWIYHLIAEEGKEKEKGKKRESILLHIFTITESKYQDFMELLLPQAITAATLKPTSKLRQQLPRNYIDFMGVSNSETADESKREKLLKRIKNQFHEILMEVIDMSDAAVDQMAKTWISQRLPVPLTSNEESKSSSGAPNAMIYSYTKLRMIRPGIARAIVEDGMVVIYHCMDNARTLYGAPINPLEFELDDGPAIEGLLQSYPEGIVVSELYHPSEELDDKISIAQALYKEGFLLIEDEASKPVSSRNGDNNNNDDDDDDPF